MENKETTAVQWLFEQLPDHLRLTKNGFDILQIANEMFEEQIIDAWCDGNDSDPKETTGHYAEQYYNKKYSTKKVDEPAP